MKQAGDWSAEHVANSLQNRHIPRLSLYTPPSCPWSPMIKGPPMLEACTKNWSSVYKKRRFSLSFYIAFDTAYFGEITYSFEEDCLQLALCLAKRQQTSASHLQSARNLCIRHASLSAEALCCKEKRKKERRDLCNLAASFAPSPFPPLPFTIYSIKLISEQVNLTATILQSHTVHGFRTSPDLKHKRPPEVRSSHCADGFL